MKKSNQCLIEAKQLCDELDPEDGVDPRLLVRKYAVKEKNHKTQQFCKVAKQVLSQVLMSEISDQLLQNLEVIDVTASEDNQFIFVSVVFMDVEFADGNEILMRLQAIQGFLRSAIARSVKRKRVPALKFQLLRAVNEDMRYAYSKNN